MINNREIKHIISVLADLRSYKKYFSVSFLLTLCILLTPISVDAQFRSIDCEKYMKSQRREVPKPTREERRIIRMEKRLERKQSRQKRKDERLHKRAVRKHNKLINGGGRDFVDNRRTYRRMKKSRRTAERNARKRNPEHKRFRIYIVR